MSLMRWFRKNNRKIMAVAVIGLMVVFIGGSALRMSCRYMGPGPGQVVARFEKEGEITRGDINRANTELAILRQIRADMFLRSRGIRSLFLAEVIFSENRLSPQLLAALRRTIRNEQLRISDEQILSLYNKSQINEIYWHLLKKEAESAGIALNNDNSRNILRQVIPQLFEGYSYSQVINTFLNRRIAEEDVLSTFGKLYAVMEYARLVCSNEELTRTEISALVSNERERLGAELVKFSAETFADEQSEPSEREIEEQFAKYKSYYPGQVCEDNPYGFGYKNSDRVRLEYIIVKLDEILEVIDRPDLQEKERYYRTHLNEFTGERPLDANDPNSPTVEYTKSFGEVAGLITARMIADRVDGRANEILSEAKELSRKGYGGAEAEELTVEELKERAGDFESIAAKLSEKHPVEVYSGRTGYLSIEDIQRDEYLFGLFLRPSAGGQSAYPLSQLLFNMEQFDSKDSQLSGAPTIRPYEVIGPLEDYRRKIAALVRVVDVRKASVPASVEVSFSAEPVELNHEGPGDEEKIYSVRRKVVEDLKALAAMETAKARSEEFLSVADEQGWDAAIEEFNRRYPSEGPNEPNTFELISWSNLQRPTDALIETVAIRSAGRPGAQLSVNAYKSEQMILDKLFSLVPADSNVPAELPLNVEIRPEMSYYCIKDLWVNRIDRNEYDRLKALVAFRHDSIEAQNLGAVHFQPANILKRMNFRAVKGEGEAAGAEPNEANEPNSGASAAEQDL